jgi:hypothetical protein
LPTSRARDCIRIAGKPACEICPRGPRVLEPRAALGKKSFRKCERDYIAHHRMEPFCTARSWVLSVRRTELVMQTARIPAFACLPSACGGHDRRADSEQFRSDPRTFRPLQLEHARRLAADLAGHRAGTPIASSAAVARGRVRNVVDCIRARRRTIR